MKNLVAGLVVLSASVSAFADSDIYAVDMCAEQVKVAVLAADGGLDLAAYLQAPQDTDQLLKSMQIKNVKLIKRGDHKNVAGMYDGTYSANVVDADATAEAKVVVTATRGGCFVKKIVLK